MIHIKIFNHCKTAMCFLFVSFKMESHNNLWVKICTSQEQVTVRVPYPFGPYGSYFKVSFKWYYDQIFTPWFFSCIT